MPFPNLRAASRATLLLATTVSAAACASVEPPRAAAPLPTPRAASQVAAPVRASTPVPNPPEAAGRRSPNAAAVTRALGGYRVGKPYQIAGVWYVPAEQPDYDAVGTASWYGDAFHGRSTANGEVFDMTLASAAHATLPLPSIVEVTNLDNDRSIQVRVNDRGPFKPGRIIDLSREAADQLGFRSQGTAKVRVRYVGRAPLNPADPLPPAQDRVLLASAPRATVRGPRPSIPEPSAAPPAIVLASLDAAKPAAAATRAASPTFAVQAGAFANRGNAERAARTLGAIAPAEVRETSRDGSVLYRVLVGAWPGRDEAAGVLGAVADAGFPDARVVSAS
jgi:rare lipoprotein A